MLDDTCWFARALAARSDEHVKKQRRQKEVRKVVGLDLNVVAVDGAFVGLGDHHRVDERPGNRIARYWHGRKHQARA